MLESLTGNLLVSSTLMEDPILSRGVCLLVHHDEENAIGVMLNRPMQPHPAALMAMLGEVKDKPQVTSNRIFEHDDFDEEAFLDELDDDESLVERNESPSDLDSIGLPTEDNTPVPTPSGLTNIHFGGPLSGPVVAIHQHSELAEAETGPGIYVAAQKQHLEDLVKRTQIGPYRLIIGHLGWESEQLASEIQAGLWHTVPATAETVFENAEHMWPRLIRRATSHSVSKWLGIPDVVGAAELN